MTEVALVAFMLGVSNVHRKGLLPSITSPHGLCNNVSYSIDGLKLIVIYPIEKAINANSLQKEQLSIVRSKCKF